MNFFDIPQVHRWHMIKKQSVCTRPVDTTLQEEIAVLQQQEKHLKSYHALVENNRTDLQRWCQRLTTVHDISTLQSCDITSKQVRLVLHVPSLEYAKDMLNRLQACPYIKTVQLLSLQPMH